eukprot:TRINITY_DN537_c0_g1_i2.p1 TRINITY_DN537_c0_g1~~TRINITY_DN537_c0_g1_i2.p1  ORF type:complete len:120 (-),score=28.39 TRINITY_DN537_c0_g1_i2:69-428(-)
MSLFKKAIRKTIELTPRQEYVDQVRYKVFGTCPTNNPFMPKDVLKTRSPRKYLLKNLVGPAMVNYYQAPEVRPLPKPSKRYKFADEEQLRSQYKTQVLKATGRGKPKKLAGGKKKKRRK